MRTFYKSYFTHKVFFFLLPLYLLLSQAEAQQCMQDVTNGLATSAISASGGGGSQGPEKAFDNSGDAGSKWYRGGYNTSTATPNWVSVNLGAGNAKILTGYLISSANDLPARNPRDWQLQGSNDGTNWTTLDTRNAIAFAYLGQSRIFTFPNTTAYTRYRLLVTETYDPNYTEFQIGEIELYEKVCLEGTVTAQGAPLSGVTIAMMGETYTIGTGGNLLHSTTTDASGHYLFASDKVPDGMFSLIVQPPPGYQILSNTKPYFRNSNWGNSGQHFRMPEHWYTYDGSITFQNHLQLAQSPSTTGTNYWDGGQNPNYLNRFITTSNNSQLNFDLKKAVISQSCQTLNGTPPYTNNLITVAQNGTFGSFASGTQPGSYVRIHPQQPGFSKDLDNSMLFNNQGFVNPTNTAYSYLNNVNQGNSAAGQGAGVLIDEGTYTVSSYIGTIADLIDVANSPDNYTSLINTYTNGWRKTYGATTGDVYDKFMAINGSSSSGSVFVQSGLSLKGGQPYLFSFDGKHGNSSYQGVRSNVTVPYFLRNDANVIVAQGTLILPRSTSSATDAPDAPWEKVFTTFTPPSDGTYRLEINYNGGATYGNDFYIDNISLRELTDYGDNPISYGEAAHGISSTGINAITCDPLMFLGDKLDIENAYVPSTNANSDNLDNLDDEDGVIFPILYKGVTSYSVSVKATNLTASNATLYAWIDWNHNGTFELSERVSATVAQGSYSVTIPLTWSSISTTGPVYARFRLSSTAGAANPTGFVAGGEVEDYLIPLVSSTISGSIWNDGNGNHTVDGSENTTTPPTLPAGETLTVYLVNPQGIIVGKADVDSDGNWSMPDVAPGTYTVVLSNDATKNVTQSATGLSTTLPSGWNNTGYQFPGSTGTGASGSITVGHSDINNLDFGLNKKPVVADKTAEEKPNPGGSVLSPVTFPNPSAGYSGTDLEDGTYPATLTGKTVTLTPGTGGDLYYDYGSGPVKLTGETAIPNFDPSKVSVDPTEPLGATSVTFTYAVTDAAGVKSDPKTVTVPFSPNPLPVTLIAFTVRSEGNAAQLAWSTASEINNTGFAIQRSVDLRSWSTIGFVNTKDGHSKTRLEYGFTDATPRTGMNYYRLRQIDTDGQSSESPVRSVVIEKGLKALTAYPNPVKDQLTVNGLIGNERIQILDLTGRIVTALTNTSSADTQVINIRTLSEGSYILNIRAEDGTLISKKLIKTK